jgi:hypothetical protein
MRNARDLVQEHSPLLSSTVRGCSTPCRPAPAEQFTELMAVRVRRTLHQEILTRYQERASMRQFAAYLHLSRWLVQRWIKATAFPE